MAWFNACMPHSRGRHILPLLIKKLRFSPVVAIQGARQTGKSFLVRELLKKELASLEYVSLDRPTTRDFAEANPESFLSQYEEAHPLAVDEAQKVPRLFDAVKYEVDQRRRPGRFLLLGSTEFSKLTLIRESLTGRMSRLRLYPLTLAETLELPLNPSRHPLLLNDAPRASRGDWMKYLSRGGMPGIFAVRGDERESLLRDWLDLTTQRDALLFPKIKADPDLCLQILEKIAILEEPDAGSIARALRKDLRRIKTHLGILRALFAVHTLEPHPSGTGKTLYFLCDVAFAKLLGANFERQIHTWLLQEQLAQRATRDDRESRLYYYRTPKGKIIHLLVQSAKPGAMAALKIFPEERVMERDAELLRAFRGKNHEAKVALFGLGPARLSLGAGDARVEVFPWEALG